MFNPRRSVLPIIAFISLTGTAFGQDDVRFITKSRAETPLVKTYREELARFSSDFWRPRLSIVRLQTDSIFSESDRAALNRLRKQSLLATILLYQANRDLEQVLAPIEAAYLEETRRQDST